MSTLSFITKTMLPIEAAVTMGVSVKDDDAIGKFGTGLKYAIAGILRLHGSVSITVGDELHLFTAKKKDIRGRTFQLVLCDGQPCGFTTELGKHWQPWQLFRELASNTLDEGGFWTRDKVIDQPGQTVIRVRCKEVSHAEKSEHVFLGERTTLVESSNGATIYEGRTPHYYFRGIRAGSFASVAPVTVDVSEGNLSEDRMLDLSTVQCELTWAFRSATKWDKRVLLDVIHSNHPADFWVQNINPYSEEVLPEDMLAYLSKRPKFIRHPVFLKAYEAHMRALGHERWEAVPMTQKHKTLLAEGAALCEAIGIDPIPEDCVRFTRDLRDEALAVTCMDTREVWFSTKLPMLGRDEFMAGYIEEAVHAMTGFSDCTREMQNALFAIIVRLGSQS